MRRRKVVNEQRRLERLHLQLLEQARDLQRNGDIQGFAAKTAEAAAVEQQLDAVLLGLGQGTAPNDANRRG
ncbi:MAG: DUF6435 family protein [Planctomycetes bacterium]|nr:DUF6435 family protein [Planctomycetota bacterium]